ncbi:MAG: Hint domain-containing protein [Paracoccaceae bacterium]
MASGTTFSVFYLGNTAPIDAVEGGNTAGNANVIVGDTFGSISDPLAANIQTFAPGSVSFTGGANSQLYEMNNNVANETFTIDGGPDQTFDGISFYGATVTYADGSTDTLSSATIFQDTAGNLYLAPERFYNSDQVKLEADAIRSITLDTLVTNTSIGMNSVRQVGAFVETDGTVDGTAGADSMPVGFSDDQADAITDEADSIEAGAGNDTVSAGQGADTIDGGDGADSLEGDEGDDSVLGGAGDDTILGGSGADTLEGGDGADSLEGNGGNDSVLGGAGDDTISGGDGADTLEGGAGDDEIGGGDGNDNLDGGDGVEDRVVFSGNHLDYTYEIDGSTIIITDTVNDGGADTISNFEQIEFADGVFDLRIGTDAADFFADTGGIRDFIISGDGQDGTGGTSGDDVYIGGAGVDNIGLGDGDDTIFGGDGDDGIGGNAGNDEIYGGAGNDGIGGDDGNDTIFGGDGNDGLGGGAGNDEIHGDAGDDGIGGDAGDDTIYGGLGADTLDGGDGSDRFIIEDGFGNDVIIGGNSASDNDVLDLTALTGPVTVTYITEEDGTITDGSDTLSFDDVESIFLSDQSDSVDATDVFDDFFGDREGIVVNAGGGSDTVFGGNGGDTIDGGSGNDSIDAGYGDDSIIGGDGDDTLHGGTFSGNDTIDGGAGNDSIDGGLQGDSLFGGTGNDTVDGEDGSDLVEGGFGDDSVFGGEGSDTVSGDVGDDVVSGGSGNDVFIYNVGDGADTIADFNTGNTGALNDDDTTNNDFIDLTNFYDNIFDLREDLADDNVLNQSNSDDGAGTVDYSGKDRFGTNEGLTFDGLSNGKDLTTDNTGVACFTSGTLIDTPSGARPVETLRAGDLVCTYSSAPQSLVWTSRTDLALRAGTRDPKHTPVRLKPAWGSSAKPILVSPQHCVLMTLADGKTVFARARHLAEETRLASFACNRDAVSYIHLCCKEHAVLTSHGRASESFYPGPQALLTLTPVQRQFLLQALQLDPTQDLESMNYPRAATVLTRREVRKYASSNALNVVDAAVFDVSAT